MPSKRQIALIVVVVFASTFLAHYEDFLPYRWRVFTEPNGTFSVAFPAEPKVEDQTMSAAERVNTTLHQITASPSKTTSYLCAYFEDAKLGTESTEQALDDARDGGVAGIQGSVLAEQRLNVSGYSARDVHVRARGNSLVEIRLVAVGGRMFMLMVADTARQRVNTNNVRRFFDSLTLPKT